ncbi:MAG TPA: glycosyltransferase family 4 protein [Membranihabitans sp.]|nr:glycosyltransferase family 4 protein [Membranihabitans sp.]
MKILQLCKKFPWPLKDGESVAVNAISKGLADLGVTMDLLAMNTKKHFTAVDSEVIGSISHYRMVKWVPVNTGISMIQALRSLLEGSSYHLKRFILPEFEQTLKEVLAGEYYDFVILESLYMVPYIDTIQKHSRAKIIFRSHNLEFEIWDRLADNNRNPLLKWYLNKLARKLRDYECEHIHKVDFLLPISLVDQKKYLNLGYEGDIFTLPLGIDLERYPVERSSPLEKIEVGFIGSLDWRPNVEGLQWFINQVWPAVQKKYPNVFRLHIAGRNMPEKIRKQASPDIIIHGEVTDAIDFIQRYDYFVVPLFSGSGMRVKILEAMAMGKIVLSTRIGIEGIPAAPDKEFIKVNNKSEFVGAFDRIAHKDFNLRILGRNARSFIEDNYSIKQVSSGFYDYLHEILRKSPQKIEKP